MRGRNCPLLRHSILPNLLARRKINRRTRYSDSGSSELSRSSQGQITLIVGCSAEDERLPRAAVIALFVTKDVVLTLGHIHDYPADSGVLATSSCRRLAISMACGFVPSQITVADR